MEAPGYSDESFQDQGQWGYLLQRFAMFTIVHSPTDSRILPGWGHEGRSQDEQRGTIVSSKFTDEPGRSSFSIGLLVPDTRPEPLLDPFDGTPIKCDQLDIEVIRYGAALDAKAYSLRIERSARRTVSYSLDEKKRITIKPVHPGDELLNDEHAEALVELVDSLVPQALPHTGGQTKDNPALPTDTGVPASGIQTGSPQ